MFLIDIDDVKKIKYSGIVNIKKMNLLDGNESFDFYLLNLNVLKCIKYIWNINK